MEYDYVFVKSFVMMEECECGGDMITCHICGDTKACAYCGGCKNACIFFGYTKESWKQHLLRELPKK